MENLPESIDLTGADLAGADLRRAFLVGARMDGCRLDDAALAEAQLSGASLDGASLRRCDLRGACFGTVSLVSAELLSSPISSSLVTGASLRGASLAGARTEQADFRECDLSGADLTDCDLEGEQLHHASLDAATRTPAPPTADDTDGIWERLASLSQDEREGVMLFGAMVFLGGDRGDEGAGILSGVAERLGLDQDDVNRIIPRGQILLSELRITRPSSDWATRVVFAFMCSFASISQGDHREQINVLGHFGEQLGLSARASARIISEELGVELRARD